MNNRWSLSESERQRLAEKKELGPRDLIAALLARPTLIPRAVVSALKGAKRGVREDPSIGWYLSGRRLRQEVPHAATGALWYGDREFVASLEPFLPEAGDALEIGAGAGRVSRLIAPRVRRLVLTDIATELLAEAKENLAQFGNVEFTDVDGMALDRVFATQSFDLIFAHDVFVTIDPDLTVAILDSASRILRPGGHLAASFLTIDHDESRREQLRLIREAAAKGRFGISHPRTYTEAQVEAMFEMVGLEIVARSYADHGDGPGRPHFTVVGTINGH